MRLPASPSCSCLLLLGLLALAVGPVRGNDWPQYRGPERQGTVPESGLLEAWEDGEPRIVWRRAIGTGYSAVAVAGGRLFTMDADTQEEAVLALNVETGETLWRVVVGAFVQAELGDGGPRSTPAVDGDAVYAVSTQARLLAMATQDGRLLWDKDLRELGPVPRFQYSVSPLIDAELLILEVGEKDKSPGVVALDKRTGAVRWTALEGPTGYSSPVAVEIDGVRQYVFSRTRDVVSLSPGGEVLWRHETKPKSAIPMPVFLPPEHVFVSASEDSFGGLMIRVMRRDGRFATEEAWTQRLMRNHISSSVVVDGHIFGFDNGTFRCLEAATGKRKWAKRGFGKGSLVAAGSLLYVLGDGGTLALAHATPERYHETGRVKATTGGRAWTSPSLAGGRLYVRDFDELVSFDVQGPPAGSPAAGPAGKEETP
jgi:outer membrane protein assembly factor BamB